MADKQFELRLRALSEPKRACTAMLSVWVDGEPVWPVLHENLELEVQVDDLLSYLTEFWKPLQLRQVFPIPVNPQKPSELRVEAMRRWAALPAELVEQEDELVYAFEEAHDFSRAFAGFYGLPPFWLLRSQDLMICETAQNVWRLPFADVSRALVEVGNQVAESLVNADAGKWNDLARAWSERDRGDGIGLLAWSAGLDLELARDLIANGTLVAPHTVAEAANDNDELRIAARMAGALPPEQIRRILTLASKFEWHAAQELDVLAEACRANIEEKFQNQRSFVQGEATARHARECLGIAPEAAIDIFALFEDLKIQVAAAPVDPVTFDGLAIRGARHGPAAFLNKRSRRIGNPRTLSKDHGARVTLAHELCHLLLDGSHAISAVDILKSRMPAAVEQRAKSFAGEFLLPSRTAANLWFESGKPLNRRGMSDLLDRLAAEFGVSLSVASWKVEHGLAIQYIPVRDLMETVVPGR